MRTLIITVALMTTVSCSTLYPVMPADTDAELLARGAILPPSITTIEQARNLVFGEENALYEATRDRRVANIVFHEITFYGTFLAVAGVVADSIAARTTGAGLAVLSTALSKHYQPHDQKLAFEKARNAMLCIKDAISPIDPVIRESFDPKLKVGVKPRLSAAYDKVPAVTVQAVRAVGSNLLLALNNMTLPPPSKEDMMNLFQDLKKGQDEGNDSADKDTPAADVKSGIEDALKVANSALAANTSTTSLGQHPTNCRDPEQTSASRRLCYLTRLNALTERELADARRHFIVATISYRKAVKACVAINQL